MSVLFSRKKLKRFFSAVPHLKHIYGFYYKHSRVRDDVVLIESFHGKTIGDSSLVLAEELIRLYPERYKIYYASSSMDEHTEFISKKKLAVRLVRVDSLEYVRLLATAGIIISNASLPTYFIRKEGQTYLQTWHGTPLKTLGKSMRLGIESMYNVQHNFLQASYILQPNDFTRDVIMRDYFLDDLFTGKVVMCGYPRNKVLLQNERREELRKGLGLTGKTVYAYMPTWRGESNNSIEVSGYFSEVYDIFDRLDNSVSENDVIYVNFHPIIQGRFDFGRYRHIVPFPADLDTYEFLSITDALITDYSSVFFDYSLTGKPVVLFMYDYEKYIGERDLYMDINELPFRKVRSADELAECIRSGACLSDTYEGSEYRDRFLEYDSPDNPEKLIRLITEGDESGFKVIDYGRNKERSWNVYTPAKAPGEDDIAVLNEVIKEKPESLVLLYRKWFGNGKLNEILHRYDGVRYVITNNNVPATYSCLIRRKLGSSSAKKEYHDADMKRRIPDIKVSKEIKKGFGKPGTYITEDGRNIEYEYVSAVLKSLSCADGEIKLTAFISGCGADHIGKAVLKYVSRVEKLIIPMETRIDKTEGGLLLSARLRISEELPLKPVNWDACVTVSFDGWTHYVKLESKSGKLKKRLRLTDMQLSHTDDNILFPFFSNWGRLKFCYRKRSEYDRPKYRAREYTALAVSALAGWYIRRKKNILVFEKFSGSAQDNSYYFFRYCMEELPESERGRVFYVIDKSSPDYRNIQKYGSNVIQFMSLKHMIYAMNARVCVSTDSVTHFYAWQTRPSFVFDRIRKVPELFLQHGVTALKKVDRLFGRHSSNPMDYFVATSDIEQKIITDNFDYKKENVPVTGFARWDALHDRRSGKDRFILIMPTWRAWLEGVTDEEFVKSEYFRKYMELLSSERLKAVLKGNGLRAVLYLHPIFASYIDDFKALSGDVIECVPFGSRPLNDIMMRSEMLITDYSSVCWDMMYMDKPVIFYQFDREKYLDAHGAYVDLENDLPGDNTGDPERVLDHLEELINGGFRIKDEYKKKADAFFKYKDDNNCRRIYDFLADRIR